MAFRTLPPPRQPPPSLRSSLSLADFSQSLVPAQRLVRRSRLWCRCRKVYLRDLA
jgi:hypothetical protein